LQCITIGLLKLKPSPNITQLLREQEGRVPRQFKQTLVCTDYWNPADAVEIFFDLERFQELMMTNDAESSTFKLWKACAEYLSKEFSIVIKEKETGKVFLQDKFNFNIHFPDDLSEWIFNRLDAYKKNQFCFSK